MRKELLLTMQFDLSSKIKKMLKERGVLLIYLFGSETTGLYGVKPDVDIGALVSHQGSSFLDIYTELYKIFSFSTLFQGKELDLLLLNEVPLILKWEIVNTGKVLFEKEKDLALDYKEKILKEYVDFQFHLKRFNDAVLEKIA